jgi:hypothetical protein
MEAVKHDRHTESLQTKQARQIRRLEAREVVMTQNAYSLAIINALGGNTHNGSCRCPCHDDRVKSLSVNAATKRDVFPPVVLKCHADCSQDMLVTWCKEQGLWPKPERLPRMVNFRPRPARQIQANEQQANEERDDDDHRRRIGYYILRTAAIAQSRASDRTRRRLPSRLGGLIGTSEQSQLLAYLNGRGIQQVPPSAMYLPPKIIGTLAERYPEHVLRRTPSYPAMVLPMRDARGHLQGASLSYLTGDGKTNLRDKDGKSVRRIVGPSKHAFVQVAGVFDRDRPLIVAEGVEKAAAVATELFKEKDYPAIATLGTENMRNNMPLPPCAEVIIAADNGAAGSKAAKAMAAHVKRAGGIARIVLPPEDFKDWIRRSRRPTARPWRATAMCSCPRRHAKATARTNKSLLTWPRPWPRC